MPFMSLDLFRGVSDEWIGVQENLGIQTPGHAAASL